jgi:O-antigen ligase
MIGKLNTGDAKKLLPVLVFMFPVMLAAGLVLEKEKVIMGAYLLALLLPLAYLVLFKLEWLVLLLVFSIPLSFKLTLGGTAISFPAELLAGLIAVFFLVYRLISKNSLDSKLMRHPLTLLVLLDLGWLVLASIFSEMPLISIKRVVVRIAFLVVFFFVFSVFFKDHRNIARIWLLYAIGLVIPIISTVYNHSHYEFAKAVSYMMTAPFYNDHTQYATCIAYVFPVLALLIFMPGKFGIDKGNRWFLLGLALILSIGEIFSWSRAAWLSIMVAWVFIILVAFLRFRLKHFVFISLIAGSILYIYRVDIYQRIEKVDAVSRARDVEEHLESVVNIQTDASNLERINRWSCAIRMFKDRPLIGFGPGTYQFVYGSYQISPEMTRISTNHGDKGNAHSEYLTYLSETGIIGFLIFNTLILYTLYIGIKIFRSKRRKELRWLALALLMGFVTYFFHGLFNSFIDTDKASVLVYGTISALVALDVYHKPDPDPREGG